MLIPNKHDGWVGGVRRANIGGGGGGGGPSSTTNNTTTIPEYARPYVENLLGQSAALTDINQNPYQVYGRPEVAGQTALQQQAAQGAGASDVGQLMGTSAGLIGAGGIAGLSAGQRFGAADAQHYMDPYQQQVTDISKREALRDYGAQNAQLQGSAASAGAFGGARHGVLEAEAQRNLNERLGDIQNRGLSAAYNNAQSQFNADQGRALQGGQLALGAGQSLGTLGNTAYTQQFQSGAAQQATDQQQLTVDRNNFNAQQSYPYQQLGFMSDILRGGPLSQTSQSFYGPQQNTGSQVAGLGLAGLGLAGLGLLGGS